MPKKIVAGNWKMNLSVEEGVNLTKEINKNLNTTAETDVHVILGAPFTHLAPVAQVLDGKIALSSQDCSVNSNGAFTGEVSAAMIASTGASYVILGHSERREYHAGKTALIAQKINKALEQNLKVIYCCGEVLVEREKNEQFAVVENQISEGLFHLDQDQMKNIVIAYEPVWAIGTGKTATSNQAQEIHAFIRKVLEKKFGKLRADNTSILYGGSCKPSNAKDLFAQDDVDGGLIGGASLKSDDFIAIINSF